jgi:LuxR family maltose regulon positive regulatory protein
LAALAIRAGASGKDMPVKFTGEDRFVSDYLRTELLSHLSRDERHFLIRTSVLDRMSGALCDALLERSGSAELLEKFESRNLLVVPQDRRREWYRYHRLLRELLQSELRRSEPDLLRPLHVRAAEWCEANDIPEAAIEHALAAADFDRAARLILTSAQPVWASGRVETVRLWMESLRERTDARYYGAIAVHGSLIYALLGRVGDAERWADAAQLAPSTGVLPDGNTMDGTLAYLRANLFRDGVASARADATRALAGLSPDSPYRATMLYTEGLCFLVEGAAGEADRRLAYAFDIAHAAGALPLAALILAERCIVSAAQDDWAQVSRMCQRALNIVHDGGFEEYWTSALVFAWAARVALHHADAATARKHLARAVRLRPLLTYALPAVSVQTLLEMAHSYIALGDQGGARAVLTQANDILQQRPELGTLPQSAHELRLRLARLTQAPAGASALTAAELRLLPLLSTHLSLREIGNHLSVSAHTVKSHAHSIYQKLGVSSRSAAVARTQELGLADL